MSKLSVDRAYRHKVTFGMLWFKHGEEFRLGFTIHIGMSLVVTVENVCFFTSLPFGTNQFSADDIVLNVSNSISIYWVVS